MKVHKQKHNPLVVTAFFESYGIPRPDYERLFHPTRKWRFDLSWCGCTCDGVFKRDICGAGCLENAKVYLEVNGGIFQNGGHNRGGQMLKDWEKWNSATILGYRPLFCTPKDLLTKPTAEMVLAALGLENTPPRCQGGV